MELMGLVALFLSGLSLGMTISNLIHVIVKEVRDRAKDQRGQAEGPGQGTPAGH